MGAAMGHSVMGRKCAPGSREFGCSVLVRRSKIAGAELATDFGEGEADAVAIGERWRWVELSSGQGEAEWCEEGVEADWP